MRRTLTLIILIIGAVAIAKAQRVSTEDRNWCQGCSPIEKQQIADRVNRGSRPPGDTSTDAPPMFPKQRANGNPVTYVLKARFLMKNDSKKKIKRVTWEYTITNRETKAFIQTTTFTTTKSIAPGKTALLKEKLTVPMAKLIGPTVPSGQAGQKPSHAIEVEEYYQIKEIAYTDGSFRRP